MYRLVWLSVACLICVSLTAVPASPSYACSGYVSFEDQLPGLVERSDTIAVGHYIRQDDVQMNGIFRVTSYLQGQGADHLAIRANDIRAIENYYNIDRILPCGGAGVSFVPVTGTFLYFLNRGDDGTYTVVEQSYFRDVDATDTQSTAAVESGLARMMVQVTDAVGRDPVPPDDVQGYPRSTPILLTTADGQHFILPVDTLELVPVAESDLVDLRRDQYECAGPPCTAYSPNGLDKVNLLPEGQEVTPSDWDTVYIESNVIGDRIAFSASSDTYALWHDEQIVIYALWYPRLGYPDDRFTQGFSAVVVTATPAGDSLDYPIAWSPDGRALAFSTSEGLWLWDALTVDFPPQLLLPTTENTVPVVRYFSPQGRYLAVTEGDRRYNLDLVTRRELPDGYISPDDRTLLVFDTAADGPTTLEVAYLAPGIRQFAFYPEVRYRAVQWIDDANFIASIAGFRFLLYETVETVTATGEVILEGMPYIVDDPFVDVVTYHSSGADYSNFRVPYGLNEIQTRDFTYEAGPGLLEISVDGYHLQFRNVCCTSLADVLPAPIVDVTWLPSAFYYAQD